MASITALTTGTKASEYALLQAVKQAILDGKDNPGETRILGAMKYQNQDNIVTWDVEFGDDYLYGTHTIIDDNLNPNSIDLKSDKPSELKDLIMSCWMEEWTMVRDPEDFNGGWISRMALELRPELEREREEQARYEPPRDFNGDLTYY